VESLEAQVQQMESPNVKHTNTIKTLNATTLDQVQLVKNLKRTVQLLKRENKKMKNLKEQVQSLQKENIMIKKA
jgi:cell shape-determining protein MreC